MKKKLFLCLTTIVLVFNSCSQDVMVNMPPYYYTVPTYVIPGATNSQGQSIIAFNDYQNGQLTRAFVNSESSTGYDDFSLYTWTKDSVIMDFWHTKWVERGWTYIGVDNQQAKYFDNFVDRYNFIGIIPLQNNNSISNGKVTVETESFSVENERETNTPKEFLYASAIVPKSDYANGVAMKFKHGNAKIYLKFTSDDSNTEIIDYSPYSAGQEGKDAWDEVKNVEVYKMTATTVPTQGPSIASINISDEDIAYINGKYTAEKGFANYATNNVITGSLDEDMYAYLKTRYPILETAALNNWASNVSNPNMRLIHIDKTGQYNTYVGVWVNVQNVNWSSPETIQVIIHHEAVEAIPESGRKGVIFLPAISEIGDGSDAVLASYPTKGMAEVSLNGLSWEIANRDSKGMTFGVPIGKITSNNTDEPIISPTTWYVLPCNDINVGYTIKISYKYKGVDVYDARVFIPSSECQWNEGKYYSYIIQLNGKGNGKPSPSDVDATDPTVKEENKNEIRLFKVEFDEYKNGGVVIKEIK